MEIDNSIGLVLLFSHPNFDITLCRRSNFFYSPFFFIIIIIIIIAVIFIMFFSCQCNLMELTQALAQVIQKENNYFSDS
jgi:hypothetical protein